MPRLAEALDFPIDRSFVAMVPLGGRHVNHLWRLLSDLAIPYATLLDLDWGRDGGGWGRIKTTCEQLLAVGRTPTEVFGAELGVAEIAARLAELAARDPRDTAALQQSINALRSFGVFFAAPLDLDYSMLTAFLAAYQQLEPGMRGGGGEICDDVRECPPRPRTIGFGIRPGLCPKPPNLRCDQGRTLQLVRPIESVLAPGKIVLRG